MNIKGKPTIKAEQVTPSNWELTVSYNLEFTAQEVAGGTFRHGFKIMERDTSDHDQVRDWKLWSLNPSQLVEPITKTIPVSSDDLDTENGGEEIFAEVRVQRLTASGNPQSKISDDIQLSPN